MKPRNHLEDTLSDPLIQTVMAADDVDPQALAKMLREIACTLDGRCVQRSSLAP
jgi:hypothetical protein